MDQNLRKRLDFIDQIRDCVSSASVQKNPFLYYLPDILIRPEFIHINLSNVLSFSRFALSNEKSSIMTDALNILNQMVNPNDGRVYPPAPNMFYNSQNFFWKELGDHTNSSDVIMHIVNKTIFALSLENRT